MGVGDELTKVSSRALKQLRWDPVLFLVAEPLEHPLLEQPAVLHLFQQPQSVTYDLARGSIAPQRNQAFHEGVLLRW